MARTGEGGPSTWKPPRPRAVLPWGRGEPSPSLPQNGLPQPLPFFFFLSLSCFLCFSRHPVISQSSWAQLSLQFK